MAAPSAAAQPSADPRVGSVLGGRYRIERKLGHGGMGAVYEATHLHLEKRVALKVMHPHIGQDVTAVERFRREAIAASRTEHPHIVQVLDMDRAEDGSAFMVMERLEGRDWSSELEETGPQSVTQVAHVVLPVLDALEAAHAAGIVHRDLKPENVFLTTQGSDRRYAKVLDFGVSKVLDARGPSTETGTTVGTPYYMSMEQLRSAKDVDARSDLYAVGVMLFRALTDTYPFHADSLPALVAKILTEPPPRLASVRSDVPAALDELVAALLAQDRDRRPPSARAVADSLRAIVGASRGDDSPGREIPLEPAERLQHATLGLAATLPSLASAAPSRRRPVLLVGALATLLASAVVGWWSWTSWGSAGEPPADATPIESASARAPTPPRDETSATPGRVDEIGARDPTSEETPSEETPSGETSSQETTQETPTERRTHVRRASERVSHPRGSEPTLESSRSTAPVAAATPPPSTTAAPSMTAPGEAAAPTDHGDLARGFLGGP